MGGLATAGRLAKEGLRVTLLEQNSEVGGRAQSVTVDGCRFDTGPSLLLFPQKYREAFEALGSRLEDHVTIRRVDPAAYRVWFGDNTHLDLLNSHEAMAAQLEAEEPGSGEAFKRFIQMATASLNMGVPNFIDRDFTKLTDARVLRDLLPMLPNINLLDLLGQHDGRLKQFFRDPRLRAMFTFQDLYVGLSPYTAPAVFSLLAGTELTEGVWYPLGGFGKVVSGLASAAASCGAVIRTGCEVAEILVDSRSSAVCGVRLKGGEVLAASTVVCNRDLPAACELLMGASGDDAAMTSVGGQTGRGAGISGAAAEARCQDAGQVAEERLLGRGWAGSSRATGSAADGRAVVAGIPANSAGGATGSTAGGTSSRKVAGSMEGGPVTEIGGASGQGVPGLDDPVRRYAAKRYEQLGRLQYSSGVIAYNWSVGQRFEQLQHHNVFLSDEYEESWSQAAEWQQLRRRPNFYAHVPSRTDPTAAPPDGDSIMVLLPVANMQQAHQAQYSELVDVGRQRILDTFRESGVGDIGPHIRHEFVITPDQWALRYGLRYGAAFGLSHGLDQLSLFRPGTKDGRIGGLYYVGASTRPGNGVPLCLIGAKLTAQRVLQDMR